MPSFLAQCCGAVPGTLESVVPVRLFAAGDWPAGLHFVVLRSGLVLLAVIVALTLRSRILKRVWGMGWRRAAIACGAGAVVFYVVWIVYLGGVMPSETVARNWNVAWLGLDGFEGLSALFTLLFLLRRSPYAVLTTAAFSTSLCIDALFDVTTAAPGLPLATAILEAVLVELPFAVLSGALALKLLNASDPSRLPAATE
ncbi:hypothetical protein E5206_09710 [Arthrobacter sp. PAMC25564]|uniref:hypothetical protein n=1 Tax=Arthrobacter sp. PAMC25564 TaxID=2565366 RepID=UPI0010A24345|nr:hypothetical protein [Arthrobacter sp. PAMC25564]QCB97176.1 hypothetical protein E5206_09710 [Arthrobacter sp. PAMC25564]